MRMEEEGLGPGHEDNSTNKDDPTEGTESECPEEMEKMRFETEAKRSKSFRQKGMAE